MFDIDAIKDYKAFCFLNYVKRLVILRLVLPLLSLKCQRQHFCFSGVSEFDSNAKVKLLPVTSVSEPFYWSLAEGSFIRHVEWLPVYNVVTMLRLSHTRTKITNHKHA